MKPSLDNVPEVVRRYFESDAERDVEGIVELFGDGAIVIDEGEGRSGNDAIRSWRTGAASKYEYTTTIVSSEALGEDRYRVSARLEGNFPGATVDLNHDFIVTNGLIWRLEIAT